MKKVLVLKFYIFNGFYPHLEGFLTNDLENCFEVESKWLWFKVKNWYHKPDYKFEVIK